MRLLAYSDHYVAENVRDLFHQLDQKGTGHLSFETISSHQRQAFGHKLPVQLFKTAFVAFDTERKGCVGVCACTYVCACYVAEKLWDSCQEMDHSRALGQLSFLRASARTAARRSVTSCPCSSSRLRLWPSIRKEKGVCGCLYGWVCVRACVCVRVRMCVCVCVRGEIIHGLDHKGTGELSFEALSSHQRQAFGHKLPVQLFKTAFVAFDTERNRVCVCRRVCVDVGASVCVGALSFENLSSHQRQAFGH